MMTATLRRIHWEWLFIVPMIALCVAFFLGYIHAGAMFFFMVWTCAWGVLGVDFVKWNRKRKSAAESTLALLPPLTDWYPPEVDPVHVGFYSRQYGDGSDQDPGILRPDYWDGKAWRYAQDCEVTGDITLCRRPWRGLSEPVGAEE
jgi:hypothetical protein